MSRPDPLMVLARGVSAGAYGCKASDIGLCCKSMDEWMDAAVSAGFPVKRRSDGKRAVRYSLALTDVFDSLRGVLGAETNAQRRGKKAA